MVEAPRFTAQDIPAEKIQQRPLENVSTQELEMRYVLFQAMKRGIVEKTVPVIGKIGRYAPSSFGSRMPTTRDRITDLSMERVQELTRSIMEQTAIKVFFGGVGEEQNMETAKKLIHRYIGTIIDNAAPENGAGQSSEQRFKAAMEGYDSALNICSQLHEFYKGDSSRQGYISAAFKFSTIAEWTELEAISSYLKKPENADKPWGQKELPEQLAGWMYDIYERAKPFFDKAKAMGIEAYADAEETQINPAIIELCARLRHDGLRPTVTVQAYLKDADELVDQLLAMYPPPNIKLVRGAYIGAGSEFRDRIWDNKQQTDDCYNRLLEKIYNSNSVETLTVASHNQESRHIAEDLVRKSGGKNNTQVVYATLMGMGNNLQAPPLELGIQERKYQPAILDERTIAVLGAIAYFGRRAKEFMSATAPGSDVTRGDLEIEEIKKELHTRGMGERVMGSMGLSMIGIKALTDLLGGTKEATRA